MWLNLRRPFSEHFELRKENEWPLKRTDWTKLFIDADHSGSLNWEEPKNLSKYSFSAASRGLSILSEPLEQETEITGPIAAKLFVSSSTVDCVIFFTMQSFSESD